MNDRDRLIELIADIQNDFEKWCVECAEDGHKDHQPLGEHLADKLLANGVIVPPCKVGDTVYYFVGNEICRGTIDTFQIDTKENWYIAYCKTDCNLTGEIKLAFWEFGKTVFLTKEEAEEKLKEMKENG